MKIQLIVLVQYKADIMINSLNITCLRHDVAERFVIWREIAITQPIHDVEII